MKETIAILLALIALLAIVGHCTACTHQQMYDGLQVAREVNDCTLLNRDARARDACLAGIAIAMAAEALRDAGHVDAGAE